MYEASHRVTAVQINIAGDLQRYKFDTLSFVMVKIVFNKDRLPSTGRMVYILTLIV